jgi:RNAse (barnase) inhibitor barstar
MQCVFHLQNYYVSDVNVIWDVELKDIMFINQKNEWIHDHSKVSWWQVI